MSNAKRELLDHIGHRVVEFVSINLEDIKIKGTLCEVLDQLDIEYDCSYGIQKLFGYVWYTDGSWSERHEYIGSESWVHKERPHFDIVINSY